MKKLLLPIFLACSLLVACSEEKLTYSEVSMHDVNQKVQDLIQLMESNNEEQQKTGIYMVNKTANERYLYVNEDFLSDGRDFGGMYVRQDGNTLNIYLNDISIENKNSDTFKIYKIYIPVNSEYMKVFKNGEETHFDGIGT